MNALAGSISGRLRALFGDAAAEWFPVRAAEAIRDMPEEDYTGQTLGPTYRYIGQHRAENEVTA